KELALNVEDAPEFERSVLGPQMASLVNQMEADGFNLYNQFSSSTGTPGTKPTDLQYFLDAAANMAEFACPVDDEIYAFLSPRTQSSMVNGLKGLMQDSSEIAKQYKKGVMGESAGMKFIMSQNVPMHTVGTFSGTPAMNGATTEGATTLAINSWGGATDSLKKGDIITIAGVYAVNPVSKQSTGQLMQFRVTADYAATSNAMAALPIDPPIYTAASGPKQNVTALPLTTAAVTIFGAAATYSAKTSPANLVIHRDALAFVASDLPMTTSSDLQRRVRDKDLGLSIRLSRYWDGVNDDLLFRLDVLCGWAVLRDKFGCRVQG
ncbi:MAG: P22 phage major capsid protein family protein, partial [Phycisphaerales bacterium]